MSESLLYLEAEFLYLEDGGGGTAAATESFLVTGGEYVERSAEAKERSW